MIGNEPDEYRFSCTLCGDCCTGPQVVRLTSLDLEALRRFRGVETVRELRDEGLVSLVREPVGGGRFAWRPRIRFRSLPLVQCPFLINDVAEDGTYRGLCSLHPTFKPLVCQLSPLTREVEDPGMGLVQERWSVVAPVEGCPGMGRGETRTVESPSESAGRLDDEVAWMRYLIAGSPHCPDEAAAWRLIAAWAGPS